MQDLQIAFMAMAIPTVVTTAVIIARDYMERKAYEKAVKRMLKRNEMCLQAKERTNYTANYLVLRKRSWWFD